MSQKSRKSEARDQSSQADTPSAALIVVQPDLNHNTASGHEGETGAPGRSIQRKLEEAQGLAHAIDLAIKASEIVRINQIHPGFFLGKGNIERIKTLIEDLRPELVIFNHDLSPVQQRNLEQAWHVKVLDRTGLILEIFGERAQTKEGRLQVDLAQLIYQRSRLVRSWTHLERQRGGAGFMGGPGETQLEIDRRIIDDQITRLKKQIDTVRRNRDLQRQARDRVPFPVIALVGYTNAGKSTLFNNLTDAEAFAEDLPFATLDPTLRAIKLDNGHRAIVSDTVGFISNLPTQLVAAFRATIEEVSYADVIVHIMDVSAEDYDAQRHDVIHILDELGIDYDNDERIIEVHNKIDLLKPEARESVVNASRRSNKCLALSAHEKRYTDYFLQACSDIISRNHIEARFDIDVRDGRAIAWLYENAIITQRSDDGEYVTLHVNISNAKLAQFQTMFDYNVQA